MRTFRSFEDESVADGDDIPRACREVGATVRRCETSGQSGTRGQSKSCHGLPILQGAQLAVDITLRSALTTTASHARTVQPRTEQRFSWLDTSKEEKCCELLVCQVVGSRFSGDHVRGPFGGPGRLRNALNVKVLRRMFSNFVSQCKPVPEWRLYSLSRSPETVAVEAAAEVKQEAAIGVLGENNIRPFSHFGSSHFCSSHLLLQRSVSSSVWFLFCFENVVRCRAEVGRRWKSRTGGFN